MRKKIVHEVNKVMLNILYYEFVNKIRFIKQLSERIAFNHSYNKLINSTKKIIFFYFKSNYFDIFKIIILRHLTFLFLILAINSCLVSFNLIKLTFSSYNTQNVS
jgi:hypothetical protein